MIELPFLFLLITPLLFIFLFFFYSSTTPSPNHKIPNTYPIIGSYLPLLHNSKNRLNWITKLLQQSSTSTILLQKPLFRGDTIFTANPANVEHILKTRFPLYEKGDAFTSPLRDLLGHGIFNVDRDDWKLQRHVASHEFTTNSLKKFVEQVVDTELQNRLIPILNNSTTTFDLQDVLQRFAFDNICKIAFGYDAALLLPSLPESKFADAFEEAVAISSKRFREIHPIVWRVKRFLNLGSERRLREAVFEVRGFAGDIVKRKMMGLSGEDGEHDLLSRFLKSGHSDEKFLIDIVISFILAGRDTTSAALSWFFWLMWKNPEKERMVVEEIEKSEGKGGGSAYDHAKELVYTHAALHESMRLYPPVLSDSKQMSGEGNKDDVLPDGTVVKKGSIVVYHVYAMGRMEGIWGDDWEEFRPERWLEEKEDGRRVFVGKDAFEYPVFQAGPRVCLGKEMALLQMKRVVAGVLREYKVVPVVEEGFQPVLLQYLTAKIEGGLPVRFERRN